jgi:hypothetical protein
VFARAAHIYIKDGRKSIRRRLDRAKNNSDKQKALEQHGTLNPRPQDVSHPLFENSEFFYPSDLLQVKYVWLANCYFAYDSSRFPVLIPKALKPTGHN